jgi:hypothetical protein
VLALPITGLSIDKRASGASWRVTLRNTGNQAAMELWLEDA